MKDIRELDNKIYNSLLIKIIYIFNKKKYFYFYF